MIESALESDVGNTEIDVDVRGAHRLDLDCDSVEPDNLSAKWLNPRLDGEQIRRRTRNNPFGGGTSHECPPESLGNSWRSDHLLHGLEVVSRAFARDSLPLRHEDVPMRCLIALCLFSATLFSAPAEAAERSEQLQRQFVTAIADGNHENAYAQMHPSLRELVDRPVFAAWVNAVSEKLGPMTRIETTAKSRKQMLAGVKVDFESTITFERGSATSELSFFGEQLVAFHVQSDQLGDWFRGPESIDLYVNRSREFMDAFFDQDVSKTRSLMHEALRDVVSAEELKKMMSQTASNAGRLISAELQDHEMEFEDGRQTLKLVFDMACSDATGEFELKFQFVGMKGHLLAFHLR